MANKHSLKPSLHHIQGPNKYAVCNIFSAMPQRKLPVVKFSSSTRSSVSYKMELKNLMQDSRHLPRNGLQLLSIILEDNKSVMIDNLHCVNNEGSLYSTNASESINAKLKRFVQYKQSNLLHFQKVLTEFLGAEYGSAVDGYSGQSGTLRAIPRVCTDFQHI